MPRPTPRHWTEADNAELVTRHAAGETLTSIAAAMGRSKRTVHDKARALSLEWERAGQTAAAAQTRSARAAEIRAENELVFAELSRTYIAKMSQPFTYVFASGIDMTAAEPMPGDQRNFMQIAEKAHRLSQEIADRLTDHGLIQQKTMLGRLVLDIGGPLADEARARTAEVDDD